ncbi:unnamed protein product, partial [Candidula unifasciata]
CPENYKAGDVVQQQEGCGIIRCYEDLAEFVGCGSSYVEHDRTSCYISYNTELNYPDCCTPNVVCAGDEGFDETQLA